MLASFNYYPPHLVVFVVGGAVMLVLHGWIIWSIHRLWLGALVGALGTGLCAGTVFASGKGDMAGLLALVYGVIGFVGGAVVGLAGSALGRALRKPGPPKPPQE
ncbi:MAG: hypothetical protein ACKODH_02705 [Limisphaerales bacterium]